MSSSWETPVQLFPQSYANGKCLWWFPCHLRPFVFAKLRTPKRLESYPKAAWERPAMFSPAQSGDLWGAEAAEGLFSTLQVSMVRCWRYIIASAEGKRWSPAASVVEPVPQFHQDLAIKKTKWPRDPFRQPRVLLNNLFWVGYGPLLDFWVSTGQKSSPRLVMARQETGRFMTLALNCGDI
jgi:hypothetical protein